MSKNYLIAAVSFLLVKQASGPVFGNSNILNYDDIALDCPLFGSKETVEDEAIFTVVHLTRPLERV